MPVPGGHPSNLTRAKERRFSQSPRQEVSVLRYQSDPLRQSAAESPCPPSPRVRVSIKCIKCSCHQTTTATPSDHTSMAAKNSYGAISSPPQATRGQGHGIRCVRSALRTARRSTTAMSAPSRIERRRRRRENKPTNASSATRITVP